jgi:hypothetical protein
MTATAPSGGYYRDTAAYDTGLPPEHGVRTGIGATRTTPLALVLAGLLTVLTAAWAGIVPFVGPLFGFSGDGSGSWHWSLAHALLGLAPAAVAVGAGLLLIGSAPLAARSRGRILPIILGLVIVACGGWFIVGFAAWPVLEGSRYFVLASPLMTLAHLAGYGLGPGGLLVAYGAFVTGWGVRHASLLRRAIPSSAAAHAPAADSPSLSAVPASYEERPADTVPPAHEAPRSEPPEGGIPTQ